MEGKLHVHINLGGDMQTNFVDVINLPGIQAKTSFCLLKCLKTFPRVAIRYWKF